MKPHSAKAKGRRFQQWIRDKLIEIVGIHPENIESRSMGAGGEDLILSHEARKAFPFSIEAKNQERVNVWKSYEQAVANSGGYTPILFIKKNKHAPLIVVDAEKFMELVKCQQ